MAGRVGLVEGLVKGKKAAAEPTRAACRIAVSFIVKGVLSVEFEGSVS
jgi:hypothetical protein